MSGTLIVDAGAAKAVIEHNRSLLPVGVVEVRGDFDEGDVVEIIHQDTNERLAIGQVNFSSTDARRVARERTAQFDRILGNKEERVVMVHRDNLALSM